MGSVATMNAVQFYGQRDVRLEKVPLPDQVKTGWVRIAPKFCGICGTDLHEYLGGANLIPTPEHPHALTKESLPLTIGHEFSGVVEEVGEGVTHVKKGDRVCIQPTLWDGSCLSCKRGLVNCCDKNGFLGLSGWGGGMSEHTNAPSEAVKLLPDNVSLEVGALVEPLSVGWHAVNISPYREGDSALVLGGGPIGLAVIQALISRGCKNIIVSEVAKRRREFAISFGAHHVVDPTVSDLVTEVKKMTENKGADVGFDCAGVQAALDPAFESLRARGTLVNVAVWEKRASINMKQIVFREKSYMGVATYTDGDFEAVIDAISTGKMSPEGMITKKIPMDKVADQGFKTLVEDKDSHVKILVDMSQPIEQ
ncbi:putative diacetyl reductase [(R)-acetoin forming] 2 [Cytospora mali]|uniref:Diacetyl reductase [(R)-acetoin forming] 2 n=1 Tax=Cytospora mali TaxID=578113 RepID=A0A194VJV7_CYTMA|nr:putative diacetyl reductase [(R)-acetoin forming] 2 [Valsa mali]